MCADLGRTSHGYIAVTNILVLHTSTWSSGMAVSRWLTNVLLDRLMAWTPGFAILERDLVIERRQIGRDPHAVSLKRAVKAEMCSQLAWADILVIGAQMPAVGLPPVLRAWINSVAPVIRHSQRSIATGPNRALGDKLAYVVITRADDDTCVDDLHDPTIANALERLGIINFHVVTADRQEQDAVQRRAGLHRALGHLLELIPDETEDRRSATIVSGRKR